MVNKVSDIAILPLLENAKAKKEQELHHLIKIIQEPIYGMALRILWNPEEAREATQEILIKIINHIDQFKGQSKFSTWMFSIASNYLIDCKKSRMEQVSMSYEEFEKDLGSDLEIPNPEYSSGHEFSILLDEIRIGCTLGMLLCLDRNHRLSYILGDIFELDHKEASIALGISPDSFRKQLSRAREKVERFTRSVCGLIESQNQCHCSKKVSCAVAKGRINPNKLNFCAEKNDFSLVQNKIKETQDGLKVIVLYRENPRVISLQNFGDVIKQILGINEINSSLKN